ncbi:MAG: CBS domain-containing protein [Candidatus Marinimicrobia bacterium]|nr:CBS domain-containing protein [Candidatus Neomarinimicrobiota bacterium]
MTSENRDIYLDPGKMREFARRFLEDLNVLEVMLNEDLIESGKNRIGAEQELMLVNSDYDPTPVGNRIIDKIENKRYTNELGTYNLEINLTPRDFHANALKETEDEINQRLNVLKEYTEPLKSKPILTGILPTLNETHIQEQYLTPKPRYAALDQGIRRLRGGRDYSFHIKGVDEIHINTNTVTVEACNTSFQVHFQVSPDDFPHWYNIAQVVAGPVLAAAVNSPLLFGRRLWQETRIAIFQRSVDTRSDIPHQRQLPPRVSFGEQWVDKSIVEVFKEDISRFRIMFAMDTDENSQEVLEQGGIPDLEALQIFNSTVYRWNRPCYGTSEDSPHFRIENRMLPSGPTPLDEVANAAFWYGLIIGLSEKYDDIRRKFRFEDVKNNFFGAARSGLQTTITWIDQQSWSADSLILEILLPLAESGLQTLGIAETDLDRYLSVIEQRVRSRQTGARWQLESMNRLRESNEPGHHLHLLTERMHEFQSENIPVHEWPVIDSSFYQHTDYDTVEISRFMQQDFYTVHRDDSLDLAIKKMQWNDLDYILVEDIDHHLQGLLLLRDVAEFEEQSSDRMNVMAVSARMRTNPESITTTHTAREALDIMMQKSLPCLPVMEHGQLVGVVNREHFSNLYDDDVYSAGEKKK